MAKRIILMSVFGVVLLPHGLFSGLFWFMALIEHGGTATDCSLSAAMFLGSFAEVGVVGVLIWRALLGGRRSRSPRALK
jgi:hypothetical protein